MIWFYPPCGDWRPFWKFLVMGGSGSTRLVRGEYILKKSTDGMETPQQKRFIMMEYGSQGNLRILRTHTVIGNHQWLSGLAIQEFVCKHVALNHLLWMYYSWPKHSKRWKSTQRSRSWKQSLALTIPSHTVTICDSLLFCRIASIKSLWLGYQDSNILKSSQVEEEAKRFLLSFGLYIYFSQTCTTQLRARSKENYTLPLPVWIRNPSRSTNE